MFCATFEYFILLYRKRDKRLKKRSLKYWQNKEMKINKVIESLQATKIRKREVIESTDRRTTSINNEEHQVIEHVKRLSRICKINL